MTSKDDGYKTPGIDSSCPPALRNRYFRGKMLTVADYEMEQRYLIQRRRLVNRAVLGWGVISGFRVKIDREGEIVVSEGVAFDQRGREVVACETVSLSDINDVAWLNGDGKVRTKQELEEKRPSPGLYLLSAHYAERPADGVRVDDGCDECSSEWNHVRETVVYSLRPEGETCDDNRPDCNDTEQRPVPDPAVADIGDRGTHATLVGWSSDRLDRHPAFDPCWKDDFCGDKCLAFDARAGVPIACVWVDFDRCGDLGATELRDSVRVRRIVYPNNDLYDLIRGCDLTRIKSFGWSDYEGSTITRADLAAFFKPPQAPERRADEKQKEYRQRVASLAVPTTLTVEFTAPVQRSSLTPDCIAVTLVTDDNSDAFDTVARMPIRSLSLIGEDGETAMGFRVEVPYSYWDGEIDSQDSLFNHPTIVEVEVRGDHILDWQGQTIAAARRGPCMKGLGHRALPSGWGAPGGTFQSILYVDDRDPPRRDAAEEYSDYAEGNEQ